MQKVQNAQLNCKRAYRAIIPFANNNFQEFQEICELQKELYTVHFQSCASKTELTIP